MTTLVILIALALLWAAVLIPPWIRNRTNRPQTDAVGTFGQQLAKLDRNSKQSRRAPVVPLRAPMVSTASPGGSPLAPPADPLRTPDLARRRRRDIVLVLVGLAFVTFAGAVLAGGVFIAVHLLVDVLLLSYVLLLVQHKQRIEEQRAKVRPIRSPQAPARTSHAALLERSGT